MVNENNKTLRNSRGFSIIELMISVGIATVVGAASAYVMTLTMNEGQKLKASSELDRIGRQVRDFTFKNGQNCAAAYSFPSAFPVANAGPVDVPMRVQLDQNVTLENNAKLLQYGLEIASVEFARAEARGTDAAGNRLYQGFVEIEARPAVSGVLSPRRKIVVGTMLAQISSSGALVNCYNGAVGVSQSMCAQLNLQYDPARQACEFDAAINRAANSSDCDTNTPLRGVSAEGRRCETTSTAYCSGEQFMTGFDTGRTVCADPPTEQVLPPGPPPPQPVIPPPPPPVVQPAVAPAPNPPPAAGAEAPPVCAQTAAAIQCQTYCFDFGLGAACDQICDQNTDPDAACGTVAVGQGPPPLAPPVVTPPPDPRPPANQCSCGGQTINNGQYCGYCYFDYEPELRYMGYQYYGDNRLNRSFREESYQCQNGQLVYSPVANPNRGSCRGDYEVW